MVNEAHRNAKEKRFSRYGRKHIILYAKGNLLVIIKLNTLKLYHS